MKKKMMGKSCLTALAFTCVLAAGCGGSASAQSGTYENTYTAAEFAENTYHTGYMTAVCTDGTDAAYKVTLELDGENYVLTKEVTGPTDGMDVNFDLKFVYEGTYTVDGKDCVLAAPSKCEWSEDWKGLDGNGLKNGSGTATSETDVTESGDVVLQIFNGEYLQVSGGVKDQTVQLDGDNIVFK